MNNKAVEYDEAVSRVNTLAKSQRFYKRLRGSSSKNSLDAVAQRRIALDKKEINLLLSIIHAHKKARKIYGELMVWKKALQAMVARDD